MQDEGRTTILEEEWLQYQEVRNIILLNVIYLWAIQNY